MESCKLLNNKNIEELNNNRQNNIIISTDKNLAESEIDRKNTEIINFKNEIRHLNIDRDSLTNLLDCNRQTIDNNDMKISSLIRENQIYNGSISKLNAEIKKLNEVLLNKTRD